LSGPNAGDHRDTIIENNYFANNWSSSANHGTTIKVSRGVKDLIIRYNVIKDCKGTACLDIIGPGATVGLDGAKIYGNVIINAKGGNGVWASGGNNYVIANTEIYNNTHVNSSSSFFRPGSPSASASIQAQASGNIVYNNLIYNSSASITLESQVTHDYNYYIDTLTTPSSETNSQIATGDPFVNKSGEDFHLTSDTDAGIVLGSEFATDPDGQARGADGIWTRGAFEKIGSQPLPPTGLRTTPTLSE